MNSYNYYHHYKFDEFLCEYKNKNIKYLIESKLFNQLI